MNNIEIKIIPQESEPMYFAVESMSFTRSIDLLLATFNCSIKITKSLNSPLNASQNDMIQLYINGFLKFTGYVDDIDIDITSEDEFANIKVKDKCVDFHDSTVPSKKMGGVGRVFNIGKGLSLIEVAKQILKGLNYEIVDIADKSRVTDRNKIAVINETNLNTIELETDNEGKKITTNITSGDQLEIYQTDGGQIVASPEQSCYDFLKKYANQLGVFITTNPQGDIVFLRKEYNSTPNIKLTILEPEKRTKDRENNILKCNIQKNNGMLYNSYYCISQRRQKSTKNKQVDGVVGMSQNFSIRNTRKIAYTSFDIIDEKQSLVKTSLFAKVEEARSLVIKMTVKGFTHDAFIIKEEGLQDKSWEVNQLVDVYIESKSWGNIKKVMMVSSYTINVSDKDSTTNLSLVDPKYYGQMSLKVKDKTQ